MNKLFPEMVNHRNFAKSNWTTNFTQIAYHGKARQQRTGTCGRFELGLVQLKVDQLLFEVDAAADLQKLFVVRPELLGHILVLLSIRTGRLGSHLAQVAVLRIVRSRLVGQFGSGRIVGRWRRHQSVRLIVQIVRVRISVAGQAIPVIRRSVIGSIRVVVVRLA